MTVINDDPLLQGEAATASFYLPKALVKELKRSAAIDGYVGRKLSPYVAQLLLAGLRMREVERATKGR